MDGRHGIGREVEALAQAAQERRLLRRVHDDRRDRAGLGEVLPHERRAVVLAEVSILHDPRVLVVVAVEVVVLVVPVGILAEPAATGGGVVVVVVVIAATAAAAVVVEQ